MINSEAVLCKHRLQFCIGQINVALVVCILYCGKKIDNSTITNDGTILYEWSYSGRQGKNNRYVKFDLYDRYESNFILLT